MSLSRRSLGIAASAALLAKGGALTHPVLAGERTAREHDMPAHWHGTEKIAFLVYQGFTALDMVGPHHMLTSLIGATTHVVAKAKTPVKSDLGLVVTPSLSFDECPQDLDIICVPGGTTGTLAAIEDEPTLRFLKHVGGKAKYITSVCTGSLLLGAAGLLEGYKATSHWAARDLLSMFGAIPTEGRIVADRNRITGGGVTAGIDFGLTLVGSLRDTQYAQAVQLSAEYAPEPPYDAGTPERAPVDVRKMMEGMFVDFVRRADVVGRAAFAKAKEL